MFTHTALLTLAGTLAVGSAPAPNAPSPCTTPEAAVQPAKSPQPDKPEVPAKPNIFDALAATGQHKTLCALVSDAGLAETFKGKGAFTLFAPTDDAFKLMDAKALADLRADKAKLADLLKGHYVAGTAPLSASDLREKKEVQSAQGRKLKVETNKGKIMVGAGPTTMATVTKAGLEASNGIVHVVDHVLLTESASKKGG